jgi:hypothetical protein
VRLSEQQISGLLTRFDTEVASSTEIGALKETLATLSERNINLDQDFKVLLKQIQTHDETIDSVTE